MHQLKTCFLSITLGVSNMKPAILLIQKKNKNKRPSNYSSRWHLEENTLKHFWMRGEITFCDDLLLYAVVLLLSTSPSACKLRHCKRLIMDIKVFKDAVREYLKLCGGQGCHVKLKPSSSHALAVKRLLHSQRSHCCSQHYLTIHGKG